MSQRPVPLAERLHRRLVTDPSTGCLNWTGPVTHNGYGQLKRDRDRLKVRAHRAAYELAIGPIPDGMQIDHLCRNRRCCNPAHLEVVTPAENTRRGNSPSAISARAGICAKGHPLTADNIAIVGRKRGRQCKTCRREYDRNRRLSK